MRPGRTMIARSEWGAKKKYSNNTTHDQILPTLLSLPPPTITTLPPSPHPFHLLTTKLEVIQLEHRVFGPLGIL
ncbi:hypothetical protein RHGRI_018420 [Rhododendron griersonianum]|uniref:Uncharacterized protein n=1 Tax=Rhododendron griersonianum TaxID=479676 RepID=A0AAV6K1F6_9ERIC|nr:hypothetical protein RHGRI_018420 [Rhododendron griersonianum]